MLDTNVVIDVVTRNPRWFSWSAAVVLDAARTGDALINNIVLAELSSGYSSLENLLRVLEDADIQLVPIGEQVAFDAGHAFARWRRSRSADEPRRVLPDFLIGAHALSLGAALATRDQRVYRTYFPDLPLITPETDHG